MLTVKAVEEMIKIARDHLGASIVVSAGIVPPGVDLANLQRQGLVAKDMTIDLISEAFAYGLISAAGVILTPSTVELIAALKALPETSIEARQLMWLRENAALNMQGLGNKFMVKTKSIVHDAEHEEMMREAYKKALTAGKELRHTRSQLVTDLRDATGDVTRDMQRVVNTEVHNAHQAGVSAYIRNTFGEGAFVFVRPNPDACDVCKKAYLEGGRPKIFKLADLASRSNIGRKKDELIEAPGLPCLHPHCQCQVFRIDPERQEINDVGQMIYKKQEK